MSDNKKLFNLPEIDQLMTSLRSLMGSKILGMTLAPEYFAFERYSNETAKHETAKHETAKHETAKHETVTIPLSFAQRTFVGDLRHLLSAECFEVAVDIARQSPKYVARRQRRHSDFLERYTVRVRTNKGEVKLHLHFPTPPLPSV
jgi:hypothetical protein